MFCPLYADVTEGMTWKQKAVVQCPNPCDDVYKLYDQQMNIIGAQNSIFGYHPDVLFDPSVLEKDDFTNIDRLVFSPDVF